jgi:YD repeat-containing protein
MVAAGVDCKVEAVAYEDYEGRSQRLQYDGEGRGVSAVVTTRDDGNDCAVLAPCALGKIE